MVVQPAYTQTAYTKNRLAAKHNYPGGVVELYLPKQSDVLPQIRYGTREPVIIEQSTQWRLLIGLALDTLPGEYVVYAKQADSESPAYSLKFNVDQKTLPIFDAKRSNQAAPKNILHTKFSDLDFSNTEQPKLPLKLPMAGQWADFFGQIVTTSEQLLNGDEAVVQNYVSLTTTELATIGAPQNAIVSRIVIGEDPQSLAIVFLDHGRGLYSIITGLTDLSVETGNGVIAGAVIGKLPVNKNSNNPTVLIWQCVINGVYVNPLILTQLKGTSIN